MAQKGVKRGTDFRDFGMIEHRTALTMSVSSWSGPLICNIVVYFRLAPALTEIIPQVGNYSPFISVSLPPAKKC